LLEHDLRANASGVCREGKRLVFVPRENQHPLFRIML
jgi:hypothetical protein